MSKNLKQALYLSENVLLGTTSSSPYLGSPTFEEVPFHVREGRIPALGTYVVIERDKDEIVHYGRIIKGTEDNPRANTSTLQQNQAYQVGSDKTRPGDRSPHVTRVMTIEVLGEIHLDGNHQITIKEPSLLAQTGQGVYEIPADRIPQLLNTPDTQEGGFYLGEIESGGKSADFILPMEAIARHLAVVGKTGVGKSYATGVLIEELVRHSIPVIAFDVLGDVIHTTEDLGGLNFRAGVNFRVPYSVIGLSEFLGFVPNLTSDQSELVSMAYDSVFTEALQSLEKSGKVNIQIEELLEEIQRAATEFGQGAVGGRAARKVSTVFKRNPLLTTGTESWLEEFAKQPITNVFVGHLSQQQRNLIVGASVRLLQALRKRDRIPPFVFVLDEVHFFLPAGGQTTASTQVIREMIRTARHDAIGVTLITQSPASMDKQVLLTCNTRLVFALDPDDMKLVSGTLGGISDEMISRIPKLPKGTAIMSSSMDIIRHPAQIRIRKRETREGAPTPNIAEEVKKWRQQRTS
ncbi:ATP-binding protein [Nostoc sp.]|uniref:ATP-binding protein n=1 Tax=Nostoc sp. TaxID=1180 RepID=UPI002FF5193F